ncbi:MAG: hypothetical protein AVDCRST_MAG19-4229 [uncultured Thermomicrobiales bacterium]|uniref:Uncharacterized protein n=1 Tax=uncultured Thermomicrobiales bacterium TaxID=1645740 RepID=A0A6J4VND1_9BACT|nr:MAG: hypothetical protein AVDCRST_MAG19-4229 [uncultured Thermomicrobiales bacterium]
MPPPPSSGRVDALSPARAVLRIPFFERRTLGGGHPGRA